MLFDFSVSLVLKDKAGRATVSALMLLDLTAFLCPKKH